MNLPDLSNWETTRECLHRVAQVIGELRRLNIDAQPNALHLAVNAVADGVSTGRLRNGGEYTFDYGAAEIIYYDPDGERSQLSLEGHTAKSLITASLKLMSDDIDELLANSRITDEKPFRMDSDLAENYAKVQYAVFKGLSHFKARLSGTMTPVVIWPHHFDMSFLWFKGHNPDEHKEPHMNFGFSPYSEGYDEPYLYFYLWPQPDTATDVKPPAPARWATEGFSGIVVDYADLRTAVDPIHLIENTFAQIHRSLAPLL